MGDGDVLLGSVVGKNAIIFAFERDFAGDLTCMPMIARLKLDRCGVKLSLKQWNRMTPGERRTLIGLPCDTVAEIDAYGEKVVALVEDAGGTASRFQIDLSPAWECAEGPPACVSEFAATAGLKPPTPGEWSRLTPLQRFVLVKLTRPGHTNANLGAAMREFGLPP